MAFKPLQSVRALWHRVFDDGSDSSVERPEITQFLCPSCGFRREPPPLGQTSCVNCRDRPDAATRRTSPGGKVPGTRNSSLDTSQTGESEPKPILPQARSWLNEGLRNRSITLVSTKEDLQTYMWVYWREMPRADWQTIKSELADLGFRDSNTFKALVAWAYARLHVKLAEKTDIALNGPPIQIVRGGLPGLGN